MNFPARHAEIFRTPEAGTRYLKGPGVVLVSQPAVDLSGLHGFLTGFDPDLEFLDYEQDTPLAPADALVKAAGQLCYYSFGPKRTKNDAAKKYFDESIKGAGHGSVLEHANFPFLCYGIDRAVTHELVRHRAGFGFSQVSQRFVDGKTLRFVERPEYQADEILHEQFETWIEIAEAEYDERAQRLAHVLAPTLEKLERTARRKAVNSAARACLPNETEAPILVTANARGWRHASEMRASKYADSTIRTLFVHINQILRQVAPGLFGDYTDVTLPDGSGAVETPYRKV